MVQGKKPNDMSNGTKYRDQSNMSYQRKDNTAGGAGKSDGRSQNGNASSFRTDTVISGARNQGEGRTLQRWQPDGPADLDGSLESGSMRSSAGGGTWDQFAENERRFGLKTDYDENIYTTSIDKNHPQHKQRLADADRKAKEIMNKAAFNSHVAEERVQDNIGGEDGVDEEDKYSGVRRQQDFPPLTSSNTGNKYTPPARRPPTGQTTVKGAPVDPAIISSQLARPEKVTAEKSKVNPSPAPKPEVATPPMTATSSFTAATPETKATASNTPSFSSRTASPTVRAEAAPNATATVEKDVTIAFKSFATQQRKNVDQLRSAKARNDKEIKLNDLKKFADSFKLHTPVPSDLVSIIAKDPAKQKEIQEKAKRNAEEAKVNPSEAVKPIAPLADAKPTPRAAPATHSTSGTSPATAPNRQNTNRNQGISHQGQYNSQPFRTDRPQSQQPISQQNRQPPGNLGSRLRNMEQTKQNQPLNPIPVQETKLPPTGPSHDPNFSRRSSGVASAQGARLNPNSSEFRPSAHAASFNPGGNPSTGSSPRSATTLTDQPAPPVKRSLLRRAPIPDSERPSTKDKFGTLDFIKNLKPGPGKNWEATGGIRPAYDTLPTWRQVAQDEKPTSTMHLTYAKLFDMTPFPNQPMSPQNPTSAVPQVPHQHQLPFHLQQGVHNMGPRQSPRQPQMNIHGNQHNHGPNVPFNGADDHRMMPSHSAQSYSSPRLQNMPMAAFQSPMGQPAQMAYNPQMIPYQGGGAPQMQQYRSLSQSHQFMPQPQMGPAMMMPNPANGGFMAAQGMAPGPQMMYPPGQGHFMPPANGPPVMPVNGYPSPGRNAAPMMMSQGSQQGHQQQVYGMGPGMSPGPQYGMVTPNFAQQQAPGQMPMRGYNGPNQFGTSPQQMHQFGPQRNNHPNGNHNKNFQQHNQHPNGPPSNLIPTGPQARAEGGDELK
ncbi:PAB1-binding 1 [Hyphodiscus hymeniophilus]|uniref:PAB1-binding 1 n=1 Tax=Hyphodiscus hymeniophilus TaxID=353542 RepID=A0A9P7B0X1_9HELO|nr:PAB1-binding 1 [Hyphodiscus hymeniophilus]